MTRARPATAARAAARVGVLAAGTLVLAVGSASAQTPEQRWDEWTRPAHPAGEYVARRDALLAALRATGGGRLLVPSADGDPRGGTFRELDDFWYLTGLELPASMLVLDAEAGTSLLFLPRRDTRFEQAGRRNDFPGRPLGDDPTVAAESGFRQTVDVATLEDSVRAWIGRGQPLRVNAGRPGPLERPDPPLIGQLGPVETLLLALGAEARVTNAYEAVARTRMIKRPVEVATLREAANATAEAIRTAAREVRAGVDEETLRGVFEATCRAEGAYGMPFTPIVKSGPNSLWPWRILATQYDRRNRAMRDGELVILDVGCEKDGYVSDVGRTFPVSGHFTPLQREKLEVSLAASDAIIAAVRPGVTLAELTRVAYDAIPDDEERYMQTPSYFGHHIGLNAGDPALLDVPLAPGMVFTVEPWYYNHDLGVSVFVEDVVLVTEAGAEVLTQELPRTPDALERMVR